MSQAKGKNIVPVEQSFLKQAGASRLLRHNTDTIRSVRKPRTFPAKQPVNSHDQNSNTWDGVFQHANKVGEPYFILLNKSKQHIRYVYDNNLSCTYIYRHA